MSVDHYENFPVASVLLPAHLREPVQAIYAFARSADDIADEGEASNEARLAALAAYRQQLDLIESGQEPEGEMFSRLAKNVRQFNLPVALLRDLLDAFSQDVVKKRYDDFAQLLDYCRRSANPVGRLLLHLYGRATPELCVQSDLICSSLQIINFWQDVAIDWQKERIYLPQDDMKRFGLTEAHLAQKQQDAAWQSLMKFQLDRARSMMLAGSPLALTLGGRIGWELRLVVQGGLRIIERIEKADYDIFFHRPKLGKWDWLCLFTRALMMK